MTARKRISLPSFELAWTRIRQCHQSHGVQETPLSMKLLGVAGVGKTYLLTEYKAEHPHQILGDTTRLPVLHISVPSSPTRLGIYKAVLAAMGITQPRGSADDLRHRVKTLIVRCKVELLMVDEVQHFIDRGSAQTYAGAADALKELLDVLKLPVIFAGAPRGQILFDHNSQLRSRVMSVHYLAPFNPDETLDEMRGFVYGLTDGDFLPRHRDFLASKQIATRLLFATDGVHRLIDALLRLVLFDLKKGDNLPLEIGTLANLFDAHYSQRNPVSSLNPFRPDFVMRRLNRTGELHQPTVLDGDNHAPMAFRKVLGTGL